MKAAIIRWSRLFVILGLSLSACKENVEEVQPISYSLKVEFDSSVKEYGFPIENADVKLTNLTSGVVNTAKSDASGVVAISSISPGNYDIEATLTVSAADYQTATGIATDEDLVFNGSLKSQTISATATNIVLTLTTGRVGDWVLKQIYYGGSNTSNGASFRDTFIEIYNNSNQTLYADSLYFSQIYGETTASTNIDLTQTYYQSTGQLDWTKATGMNNDKANTDYIYAKSVFMVPGTGKQYPVEPGKSFIIATTAMNHQEPFTNLSGDVVTVKDPTLTVDLSSADFEVYLGDYPGNTALASDLDNPAVPNMTTYLRGNGRDLIFDAPGRESYAIFKTPTGFPYTTYPSPKPATGTVYEYMQIPNSVVIDAVEIQPTVTTSRTPKRLPDSIDAGYTFNPGGQYSSQSVIRKTAKTVDGRKVLKDSNNSTNDFGSLTKADPSKTAFVD